MKSQITYSSDGNSIVKRCQSPEECANELRVYSLHLDFTPDLLRIIDERTIEISLIKGNSLSNETEFDFSVPGNLLSQLHRSLHQDDKVLCHLDTNPRNYLIEDETGRYFLIDFSESGFSLPENDLVNFLLFWAAIIKPDRFQRAMRDFLAGYEAPELLNQSRQDIFPQYFDTFDERRRKYCKSPGTVFEWQRSNRHYLINNFYPNLTTINQSHKT